MKKSTFLCLLPLVLLLARPPLFAATGFFAVQEAATTEASLKKFLQEYVNQRVEDKETRYSFAFADLNEDGTPEVVVYLMGRSWCGSGGCTALILASSAASYKVVTRLTITRCPIRMLTTKTAGWHDLGVRVQGGGIQSAHEAVLRFNGKTYPSNPSLAPRLVKNGEGRVLISEDGGGVPLY